MKGVLLVDAGSSKTDWSFLNEETREIMRIKTPGINPALHSYEQIKDIIKNVSYTLNQPQPEEIYFFGAGCASKELNDKISTFLNEFWQPEKLKVQSDIMAAAIALFGVKSGIVAILGTGSNSCLYGNGEVIDQIPSLGYILGDEGSGAALGKRLLNYYFKRQLPEKVSKLFETSYHISISEVIKNTYRGDTPSAYLASFSPFLLENKDIPEIRHLIVTEFRSFFEKNIIPYRSDLNIGFVGSIAWHYKEIILDIAKEKGLKSDKFIKEPMPDLEKYFLTFKTNI